MHGRHVFYQLSCIAYGIVKDLYIFLMNPLSGIWFANISLYYTYFLILLICCSEVFQIYGKLTCLFLLLLPVLLISFQGGIGRTISRNFSGWKWSSVT